MRRQPYHFGLADTLLAEVGHAPLDTLHRDVDAICRCYDAIVPVADRLGAPVPRPRIAGFSYTYISALGAAVIFPAGSEPNVAPLIRSAEDIDAIEEPADYLASGVAPQRLETMRELARRRPDAEFNLDRAEGPLTSAALLMGQDFFRLPYEDPARAHRLLGFVVRSSLNYNRAVRRFLGEPEAPGAVGLCDDFAGIFPPEVFAEFVVPYWEETYAGQNATERHLHSELLREGHLPFLAELGIATFDPSADQYVTPEFLRAHCPVPFTARIQAWDIRDKSPRELQAIYRRVATAAPVQIAFYMTHLADEDKIRALLEVARELAFNCPAQGSTTAFQIIL
jgi:hypothetical protein